MCSILTAHKGRSTLDDQFLTPEILLEVQEDFLAAALDDWVYLAELQGIVIQVAAEHKVDLRLGQAEDKLDLRVRASMQVIERTLRAGLIEVGELPPPGYFRRWDLSEDAILERIRNQWEALGSRLSLGDVCWFELTDAGRVEASRVLPLARRRWKNGR